MRKSLSISIETSTQMIEKHIDQELVATVIYQIIQVPPHNKIGVRSDCKEIIETLLVFHTLIGRGCTRCYLMSLP